jgi:hypothetical protein
MVITTGSTGLASAAGAGRRPRDGFATAWPDAISAGLSVGLAAGLETGFDPVRDPGLEPGLGPDLPAGWEAG